MTADDSDFSLLSRFGLPALRERGAAHALGKDFWTIGLESADGTWSAPTQEPAQQQPRSFTKVHE